MRLAAVFLVVLATVVLGTSCFGADEIRISSLPTRIARSIAVELRIRELVDVQPAGLALIATLHADLNGHTLFNPFGIDSCGSPYDLVLTDPQWNIVKTIVRGERVPQAIPDRTTWIHAQSGGIVGRCFRLLQPSSMEIAQETDGMMVLPTMPAGRYYLFLLVKNRIAHKRPPESPDEVIQKQWLDGWNASLHDASGFASLPVAVDVDREGRYQPVQTDGTDARFEVLEVQPTIDSDHHLRILTRLINPTESWMMVPGLNLMGTLRNPVQVSVDREDGAAFDRFPDHIGGSYSMAPRRTDAVLVPRDGVIGGTDSNAATLKQPGGYLVKVEINESIYLDKLFVNGERVHRGPSEWPVVFRSPTRTVIVKPRDP